MKEDHFCPKCGEKLSPFYLKPNCPACGVDMLRWDIEGRMERDAVRAEEEVEALWRFLRRIDKARLIEKYCAKKGRPLPWEDAAAADETASPEGEANGA